MLERKYSTLPEHDCEGLCISLVIVSSLLPTEVDKFDVAASSLTGQTSRMNSQFAATAVAGLAGCGMHPMSVASAAGLACSCCGLLAAREWLACVKVHLRASVWVAKRA